VRKILITTGGSGGHVIPAKIIYEHLSNDFDIFFSTDLRGFKFFSSENYKIEIINTPKISFNIFFPINLIKLIYLIAKSIFFLKKEKIDKVISIGGYMSLPVIIASKILGLIIILIEPNMVLGRGNRFFLNFAKKILCYSDNIYNFPKKHIHKIELIKPLVSKSFYDLRADKNSNDKFCFLIVGGSQGAKIFDELIKDVIFDIAKKFSIKIIQQTSKENIDNLKKFYDDKNIENQIFDFEKKFHQIINFSDLCITRAGASSLAEMSLLNKPFIAIPLPSAKDDHQLENANFYLGKGCCWVLDQKTLSHDKLLEFLLNLLNNKSELVDKKSNLEKLNYNNSWSDINKKLVRAINEN
jgi:UDP-N-acetylglucosamine--N-acetylmuramyl-(pentapeptide) pyrophosphoryl-undecaprenol N-acetylglucosamine transferase